MNRRDDGRPDGRVLVSVEVDARSVRRGDQVVIGGQPFTVRDLRSVALGGTRLEFATGESFVMRRTTVLWAARRHDPRLPRRRWANG
ncbi:hypothetical protein [Streptomyces sp. SBT349]|uniref:hypothetical protein n=1 Tax=Streptomyces sp. SBT349 TaxID=1580539 RepID=UPI00066C07BB|nr:hypothetical protein [Streptomyces sp. SBT349]